MRQLTGPLVRALGALLLLQAIALLAWYGPLFDGGPMLIIAHRGDTTAAPENTREAILAAIARDDLDGVEMDVMRSRDGTWWVFHDADTERLVGTRGALRDLTDQEIASLRIVGGIGYDERFAGLHGVPRLEDLLPFLTSYDGILIFDVKERDAEAHAELARIVEHQAQPMIICRTIAGARAVKSVDTTMPTLALTTVANDAAIDFRLADAGFEITSPLATLGQSVAAFVHQDTSDESEWRERADRWGVRLYIAPTE